MRDEFTERLRRASRACLASAREVHCEGPLPDAIAYYAPEVDRRVDLAAPPRVLRVPRSTLVAEAALVALLLRNDGVHRPDIRLAPVATTAEHTVIEATWDGDFTTTPMPPDLAVHDEPFMLRGPSLPPTWIEGDPIPRVKLPSLELLEDDFDWTLAESDCAALYASELGARIHEARLLAALIRNGRVPDARACELIVSLAVQEPEAEARREMVDLLSLLGSATPFDVWVRFASDPDPEVQLASCWGLAEHHGETAFAYLLRRLPRERTLRGQRATLRTLAHLVRVARERAPRLSAVLDDCDLDPKLAREVAAVQARLTAPDDEP